MVYYIDNQLVYANCMGGIEMDSLYSVSSNESYYIEDKVDMNLLNTLGIYQGAVVFKKRSYRLGGPVLVEIDGRGIAVGKSIANKIIVKKVGE